MIIPTAEPFFFPGGSIGVLLVHGFTGTPKEMRWMGEDLANRGYTTLGIRLAGHATQPDDILRSTWQDWLTSVEDGYHLLAASTSQLVVAGLSMGGALTLLLASQPHLKGEISGVIAMSTPYDLPPDPRLAVIRWIWPIFRHAPKGEADWQDPSVADDHISYPTYPTRALIEVKALVKAMQAALPRIQVPTLLMHSEKDRTVSPDNMPKIYQRLGTADKSMLWFKNSGHVITRDQERQRVFQAADQFIQRVCLVNEG